MGVKSPTTFGDYYWAKQVEANALFDENIESAFAPMFAGILRDIPSLADIPAGLRNFVTTLAEPPSAGFGGFALGVGVEMIDETLHTLMNPMMKIMSRAINRGALETWLTSNQGNTLFRRGKIQEDFWNLITASEGLDSINAKFVYQAQAPYPSIPDIMLYSRYHTNPENIREAVWDKIDVDAQDFDLWEWLGLQRITTEQVQTLHRRGIISESDLDTELSRLGWRDNYHRYMKELSWLMPNPMLMVQAGLLNDMPDTEIHGLIQKSDIHPRWASAYLDAIKTKPASQDIIAYALRQDPSLNTLERELRRIGIHENYLDVYKTLAYQIPPVQDIITMAVREAFTPSIAQKFGQYEDFPPEFAYWAERKGLSKEWAEKYWASHWGLPSVTQGFEMLHRGIIDENELRLLLKALDIMPFWRDRLIEMSYRPLTRIDVRRMYKEGVLDEQEVIQAYLNLGYSEENAKRMGLFTVRQALSSQAKFSSSDVINAFTKFVIDRSEATALLKELGIRTEDVGYMLNLAEHKREWEVTETKIEAIRNKYKKDVLSDNEARDSLHKFDLPSNQVDALMDKWYYEPKEEKAPTWTTAQTIKFAKTGLITRPRAIKELQLNGYDTEHIDIYLAGV